jgi:hypothetical protein
LSNLNIPLIQSVTGGGIVAGGGTGGSGTNGDSGGLKSSGNSVIGTNQPCYEPGFRIIRTGSTTPNSRAPLYPPVLSPSLFHPSQSPVFGLAYAGETYTITVGGAPGVGFSDSIIRGLKANIIGIPGEVTINRTGDRTFNIKFEKVPDRTRTSSIDGRSLRVTYLNVYFEDNNIPLGPGEQLRASCIQIEVRPNVANTTIMPTSSPKISIDGTNSNSANIPYAGFRTITVSNLVPGTKPPRISGDRNSYYDGVFCDPIFDIVNQYGTAKYLCKTQHVNSSYLYSSE